MTESDLPHKLRTNSAGTPQDLVGNQLYFLGTFRVMAWRLVVLISDEAPRCGQTYDGDDRRLIDHVIPITWDNRVIVSPIVEAAGTGKDQGKRFLRFGVTPDAILANLVPN